MGASLWLALRLVPGVAGMHGFAQIVLLLVLVAGGAAIYGLFLGFFGVTGWREAVGAVRQKRTA
jgi:putative peptidoglycan lipid II flippase